MRILLFLVILNTTACCLLDSVYKQDNPTSEEDAEIQNKIHTLCMDEKISQETTYKDCASAWR